MNIFDKNFIVEILKGRMHSFEIIYQNLRDDTYNIFFNIFKIFLNIIDNFNLSSDELSSDINNIQQNIYTMHYKIFNDSLKKFVMNIKKRLETVHFLKNNVFFEINTENLYKIKFMLRRLIFFSRYVNQKIIIMVTLKQ